MTTPAVQPVNAARPSKSLHVALWVIQVLLAALFGMVGAMKASQPMSALIAQLHWPAAVPEPLVRFIGTSELLGALGLILPPLTRVKPWLTSLAGAGLVTVMTLAAVFHISRGEWMALPLPLVLAPVAGFVAWGRWKKAPIESAK